jgi:FMN reductase
MTRSAGSEWSAVTISGSPSPTSKSRVLLEHAGVVLTNAGFGVARIDLATLPAPGLLARERSREVDAALASVASSTVVVASTPVYRATYSGLLKVFFDLMRPDTMVGKIAVPIATGATPEHMLAIQHGLMPLFASVGAILPSGIYGTDAQFHGGRAEPALLERVERAVNDALALARSLRRLVPSQA